MVRKYKYISFSDRKQIAALYLSNTRPADIAEKIGVSAAAVYRELKRGETAGNDGAPVLDRNQRRAYNPVVAQHRFARRSAITSFAGVDPGADQSGGYEAKRTHLQERPA